jgi:cation diffusion facilitator CzcD-associated flavoprotein CzcO
MPRRYGRWPVRDDVIEYLEEYARRQIATRFAVLATGRDASPKLPEWRGREGFTGELIHSAAYRNAEPFKGKDVLVVSARNTGSEIAYELATTGGCRVWTSMRTPPSVVPREWPPGFPLNFSTVMLERFPDAVVDQAGFLTQRLIYGNLADHGIPRAPLGVQSATRKRHVSALIDAGFIQALKDGRLELVAAVDRFEGPEVLLVDGSRLRPQVVIAATGYDTNLPGIVGHLGVLNGHGLPALNGKPLRAREHPSAPGLFFTGYYASTAGQLRFMRIDGRRIARAIAREA